MDHQSVLNELSAWLPWAPIAEQLAYLFLGAVILAVVACIATQLWNDKAHPINRNRNTTLLH
jgi:hypothetical protein